MVEGRLQNLDEVKSLLGDRPARSHANDRTGDAEYRNPPMTLTRASHSANFEIFPPQCGPAARPEATSTRKTFRAAAADIPDPRVSGGGLTPDALRSTRWRRFQRHRCGGEAKRPELARANIDTPIEKIAMERGGQKPSIRSADGRRPDPGS
jgi:hypothetical protein